MSSLVIAHGGTTLASYGTDWLYLLGPLALLGAAIAYLAVTGEGKGVLTRIGASLERVTGLPAWSAAGVGLGLAALIIALFGFMWDVSWHIDYGRDKFLLTPPHMMILFGLATIAAASGASILYASRGRADVGLKVWRGRVPFSALALGALGGGALCGFPLDELWHQAYGVDVTMWGPTHLLMIGGASLTPLALWLMIAEARPSSRESRFIAFRRVMLAGAVLIGLSTMQGEFDFGVPQFQQLYHPILIAIAASIGFTAARAALGRGGAVKAALVFLVIRGGIALTLGTVFGLTVPHFPLYLAAAVTVEATWSLHERWGLARGALTSGALVGTVGLGAEWLWTHLWGYHPWDTTLFPAVLLAIPGAVAGAYLGGAMGRVLGYRPATASPRLLAACGLGIVALLVVPYPRTDAPLRAEITTDRVDAGRVRVNVAVDPADEAREADWFEILAWQGNGMELIPLAESGDGTYASESPVPVGGNWKTLVRFAHKDVMVAAPVYLPKDPAIGAPEVPVVPYREIEFRRDTELLLRESHEGPAWPSLVAYTGIAIVALAWLGTLSFAFARVDRGHGSQAPSRSQRARFRSSQATTSVRPVRAG